MPSSPLGKKKTQSTEQKREEGQPANLRKRLCERSILVSFTINGMMKTTVKLVCKKKDRNSFEGRGTMWFNAIMTLALEGIKHYTEADPDLPSHVHLEGLCT